MLQSHNFHIVGGESQGLTALDAAPAIVMAEGYATADTLSQALGYPVIAAFDSGNLPKVAQDLHHKYPHKPIIIAGDDDHHLESTLGKNPGVIFISVVYIFLRGCEHEYTQKNTVNAT